MTTGPLTAARDARHPSLWRGDGVGQEHALWPLEPSVPVVDIVIPVHNEAHVLEASVSRLYLYLSERFPLSWRITIVDNASTDGTWAAAGTLSSTMPGVRAIQLDRKGRGLALRRAWLASDARIVAYMDVDLSTDLGALLPLVAPLVSGHSDVAIGSRLAPSSRVARPPKRELISRSYNLILKTVFGTHVRDAQCGFKAVRSDVARRLLPDVVDDAWFFDTELLLLAERNGLRIHEVPVDWVDDPDSRVDVRRTAIDDLRGVWRVARTFRAGRGYIDLGGSARPALADDMGRQLVSFGLVGAVSTAVSLALFVLLRAPLGVAGATVLALGATAFGNLWANRRWTFGRRDASGRLRYYARSGLVLAVGMAVSAGLLTAVAAAGGDLLAELATLFLTWSLTMLARFRLLRSWAFPGPGPIMSATVPAGATARTGAVFGRMARCLSVSVLTTLLSLVTLALLIGWWGTTSWVANVVATAVGTVPSYVLNRRWVWGRDGSADVWREVVPFWALSFSGLVLSTAAVATADASASSIALVGPTRTALLLLANLGSFAVLWVGQFLVLDRVLFGPPRRSGHRPLDRLPVAGGEVGLEGVVDRPPVVRRLRPAELEQSGELLPAAHQLP